MDNFECVVRNGKEYKFKWYGKKESYDFNYVLAFMELALPYCEELPESIIKLVIKTYVMCKELKQNKNLDMPWPNDDFKNKFDSLSTKDLSQAARIVYFAAHWFSRPVENIGDFADLTYLLLAGTSWKFANYCDQILRERLDVPKDSDEKLCGILIHEGMVRVYYNTKDCWMWEEVGLATEEKVKLCKEMVENVTSEDDYDCVVKKLKAALTSFENDWLNVSKTYKGKFNNL
jgi:hypothetical protein